MKLRGYLALVVLCVSFPFFDLFQRLVLTLWVTALPSRRIPAMGRWIQFMASFVFWTVARVGGAKIQMPPQHTESLAQGRGESLNDVQIKNIESWIDQGAKNN